MNVKYKNILLVNPWQKDIYPPPSIGYLQAAIKSYFKNEINVFACNFNQVEFLMQAIKFDLIAASFHSFSVKNAIELRNKTKGIKLICGGHHPSSLPEQMISIGYDQVVIGEGENALIDIILGNEEKIIKNSNKYFASINDIPFPDYSGLGNGWTDGYPIISSRGCPFECNFCASSIFWDRKWNMRDPHNIIKEILYRIKYFGMKTWMFEDDNFTLSKKRAIEICNLIIENNINLQWQCASRAESLQDENLSKSLYEAGCRNVWLGIESLSQNSLDRCQKNTTVEKMINGITIAKQIGLNPICQFIIGLPGDTIEDINETAENIKKFKIPNVATNIAWILPNTSIHTLAKEKGFSDDSFLTKGVSSYTYEHSLETLKY